MKGVSAALNVDSEAPSKEKSGVQKDDGEVMEDDDDVFDVEEDVLDAEDDEDDEELDVEDVEVLEEVVLLVDDIEDVLLLLDFVDDIGLLFDVLMDFEEVEVAVELVLVLVADVVLAEEEGPFVGETVVFVLMPSRQEHPPDTLTVLHALKYDGNG